MFTYIIISTPTSNTENQRNCMVVFFFDHIESPEVTKEGHFGQASYQTCICMQQPRERVKFPDYNGAVHAVMVL